MQILGLFACEVCVDLYACSKTLDRERTSLMTERDRQNQTLRTLENEYGSRQLEESEMKNKTKDRDALGKEIETLMKENTESSAKLKVS